MATAFNDVLLTNCRQAADAQSGTQFCETETSARDIEIKFA